jgi:hypothetical protein
MVGRIKEKDLIDAMTENVESVKKNIWVRTYCFLMGIICYIEQGIVVWIVATTQLFITSLEV